MRLLLFLVLALLIAGCENQPITVFAPEHIDDNTGLKITNNVWGKNEYAPNCFAGFKYDSTGMYINLNTGSPELIQVTFLHIGGYLKKIYIESGWPASNMGISIKPPNEINSSTSTSAKDSTSDYKNIGPNSFTAQPFFCHTFWVSWNAIGLDGPPKEGTLNVYIIGMKRLRPGARYIVKPSSPELIHLREGKFDPAEPTSKKSEERVLITVPSGQTKSESFEDYGPVK